MLSGVLFHESHQQLEMYENWTGCWSFESRENEREGGSVGDIRTCGYGSGGKSQYPLPCAIVVVQNDCAEMFSSNVSTFGETYHPERHLAVSIYL